MNTETAKAPVLVRGAGEGPATWALGSLFERLASHDETAGAFDMSLVTQPAGTVWVLRRHARMADWGDSGRFGRCGPYP